ncbi:MAG: hypothetical protein PHT96_11835 [Syntrophorhabdaceae bacterium]|nr:hypothetical protein [Syntrophorhabdaceae bacterium]MDD4197075.1 hypothetical protein [Syntrophorhabdaceae bacterium]
MTQNSEVPSITVKQARAIPVIIRARSIEAGCAEVGISKTLFYQWLKKPDFAEEYRRHRDVLVNEAMESLKESVGRAVDSLTALLDTDNESLRRALSNDILNHVLKIKEMQEVENRLSKPEQLMEER